MSVFSAIAALLILGCVTSRHENHAPTPPPFLHRPADAALASAAGAYSSVASATQEGQTPAPDSPSEKPAGSVKSKRAPLSSKERESLFYHVLQGSFLEEKDQFEKAGESFRKAMEVTPDSSYLSAITGNAFLQNGDTDQAVRYANQALQRNKDLPEAYRVLGQAYLIQQKWDLAVEQYEKVLALRPNDTETREDLAVIYTRLQRYDDAIRLYRRLAALSPAQALLYRFRVATLLFQLNRFEEALAEYQDLAKTVPPYYEMQFKIGNLQELLGQSDAAIETYRSTLSLIRNEQEELAVRQRLGALYRIKPSSPEAFEQYNRIKEITPEDMEVRKILALMYIEQNQFEKAMGEVETLAEGNPGDFRMQLLRREVLDKLGRTEEGFRDFLEGFEYARTHSMPSEAKAYAWELSRDENLETLRDRNLLDSFVSQIREESQKPVCDSRYLFAAAKISLFQENTDSVAENLQAIVRLADEALAQKDGVTLKEISRELRLWFKVRQVLKQENRLDSVANALNQGLQALLPDDPDLHWTLGMLSLDNQQWNEAETHLLEVKKQMEPGNGMYQEILYQLASVYEKQKRIEEVETLMKEAMLLDPDDAQAYNFLGYLYAEVGIKLSEALALVEKAHRLNPEDGNIIDSLGWVYYRLGRYEEAVTYLQKASDLENDHPVILDHLGDAFAKQGKTEPALESWKKALQFGPEFPSEFTPEFRERIEQKIREAESQAKP